MNLLKFLIALALLHLISLSGWAQTNFVLNGSFEKYNSCPTSNDQISRALFWKPIDSVAVDPYCAPELCHVCAGANYIIGVPFTFTYNHYPRTGGGMVQIAFYVDNDFSSDLKRNYLQGRLQSNLIAGKPYCVTYYVTLTQISQYAVNRLGAYLDDGSIDHLQDSITCGHVLASVTPQLSVSGIVNDSINWVKVQGSFIAIGTEKFITIGNFVDNASTDTIVLNPTTFNSYGAYLLDDVSVIESTATAFAGPDALIGLGDTIHIGSTEDGMPTEWYVLGGSTPIGYGGGIDVHPTTTTSYVVMLDLCGHITYDTVKIYVVPAGVSSLGFPADLINLYPSPATNQLHIDHAANCTITLTDITGHTCQQTHLLTDKETIDISTLLPGTYIATLTDERTGDRVVKRMVKE